MGWESKNSAGDRISGLYAIADPNWNPLGALDELVGLYLEGGCRLIQLRIKDAMPSRVRDEAKRIMRLKLSRDFTFIVNDHADVAVEVGADGIHVGKNDMPVDEIRKRYGDELLIGYSSHSLAGAKAAEKAGADYVAFGAIFPTKTKGPGHPIQGLGRLREVTTSVNVPVVAIGGITRDNVASVIEAGASSVAMITAISQAENITEETRWFVKTI